MKLLCFVCIIVLLGQDQAFSQSHRYIKVDAGDDAAQAYAPNGFYRFHEFQKATVYLKTAKTPPDHFFNYNLLSGTMQFIHSSGDTLDIANIESVDSVVFENAVFHHRDGFMEVVATADSVSLLKKTVLQIRYENIGGYGSPSPTAAIVNVKSVYVGSSLYSLRLSQNATIDETTSWYWMDSKANLVKATRANLKPLISAAKQSAVESFLKKEKINFEKEKDLVELMVLLQK